jgi:RNA polymerase sigma-70 factor (ECF subfamily)
MDRLAVFTELRPLLFSLAYRMLGSRADADDLLQDAYLRWQQTDAEVESPKAYLTSVVSRLALDQLKSARRRREEYVGTWLPEPIATPAVDPVAQAESLSLALLHVLESLPPAERVAFVLREVFGSDYAEVAEALGTSEANSRQLVTRARKHVQERRPRRRVDREQHQETLRAFQMACAQGSAEALLSLLREDAVLYSDGGGKAAAATQPVFGVERVIKLLLGVRQRQADAGVKLSASTSDVNGEPSLLIWESGVLRTLVTLDLDEDGRIRAVFLVRNPDKLTGLAGLA